MARATAKALLRCMCPDPAAPCTCMRWLTTSTGTSTAWLTSDDIAPAVKSAAQMRALSGTSQAGGSAWARSLVRVASRTDR